MTILEAHKEFKLFIDKVDSQATPDFLSNEIDTFLHEAEVRLVKQKYGRGNKYGIGFQENQKRTDDLSFLVKSLPLTFISNEVTLPSDYMFYLAALMNVKFSGITAKTIPFLCPLDKLHKVLSDPFNKSTPAYPIIWQEGNKIKVAAEEFEATSLSLTYLKYPVKVSKINLVSSELSEQMQKEAIQLAVTIALENVESSRMQTNPPMLGTIE
jgi:hypothetical protein